MSILRTRLRADRLTESIEVFPLLDVERIERDLRLKTRGAERGAKNLPAPGDEGRDSIEHEIIDTVGRLRSRGIGQYETHMNVYSERLRMAQAGRVEIERAAGGAETTLKNRIKQHEARLASIRDELKKTGAAFQVFVTRNGLEGIPGDGTGWVKFGLIAFTIIVLEGAGNAFLFGEASDRGLLGGFFVAFLLSTLNVGTTTTFVRLGRHIIHRRWLNKILGVVSAATGMSLTVLINLGAAHFRDATERLGEITAAARDGLASLLSSPLGLESLQSWGLFGLGMICAALAAAKGISIDDPYPGFSAKWRAVCAARDRYADELADALDEIEEVVKERIDALATEAETARDRIESLLSSTGSQWSVTAQLPEFLSGCDRAASRLLAIYRDANREARSEVPPEGFGQPYTFPSYTGTTLDPEALRQIKTDREEIRRIVDEATRRIHTAAHGATDSYPTVKQMEDEALGYVTDDMMPRPLTTPPADQEVICVKAEVPSSSATTSGSGVASAGSTLRVVEGS